MSVQAASEQLKQVGIFQGLGDEEIRALLSGAERREFAAGATIYKEGDAVEGFYVIETGKVVVRKSTGSGQAHDLATLEAKHVVGEMGLLVGDRPRTATVVALEKSALWHFPAARFTDQLAQGSAACSKVVMNMARVLAHRLDAINKELVKVVDSRLKEGKEGPKDKKLAELAAFKDKLYKEWSF
jgi:CRP/FNR family transcriptional regulator, cyclic AMP receptor protein